MLCNFDRHLLSSCENLGVGNFFEYALRLSTQKEKISIFTDVAISTPSGQQTNSFSLDSFGESCNQLAYWYQTMGVKPNDCIVLYMNPSLAYLMHQIALNKIGAIPVYSNGNLDVTNLHSYLSSFTLRGIITDQDKITKLIDLGYEDDECFVVAHASIRMNKSLEMDCYSHVEDSPILISHSSGTTGVPKPVVQRHAYFFEGIRQFLMDPPEYSINKTYTGAISYLSVLPTAHNSFLAYCMRAILTGANLIVVTQDNPEYLLKQIKIHRPSIVVGFAHTFQKLSQLNRLDQDLDSISYWINTGDAAHKVHIEKLIQYGNLYKEGSFVKGSIFLDGLGSSEMGSTFFCAEHAQETDHPLRCIGYPRNWVQAKVFDEQGVECKTNIPGRLGVYAATLTKGYWNDHLLTERSKIGKFFLTGDIVYKDAQGRFFHLDRISDVIKTPQGTIFSILAEEIIFSLYPDLSECVVVEDEVFLVDFSTHIASYDLDLINEKLQSFGMASLRDLKIVLPSEIPLGVTGKVLKKQLRGDLGFQRKQQRIAQELKDYTGLVTGEIFKPLFHSRFLQRCQAGLITAEEFKRFLAQHFAYARHFTRFLCAIIGNLEDLVSKNLLFENLVEELGADKPGQINHGVLYRCLLKDFGISHQEIRATERTQALIDSMMNYCKNHPPLIGLSVLCFGAEAIVPYIYSAIIAAGRALGFNETQLIYFKLHVDCDDGHAATLINVIKNLLNENISLRISYQEAVRDIIQKRVDFFDNILETDYDSCQNIIVEEAV